MGYREVGRNKGLTGEWGMDCDDRQGTNSDDSLSKTFSVVLDLRIKLTFNTLNNEKETQQRCAFI